MNKIDAGGANSIRMLSLDMIKEAGSGDSTLAINSANLFYTLYMYHLNYNNKDTSFINRDRIVINNRFMSVIEVLIV